MIVIRVSLGQFDQVKTGEIEQMPLASKLDLEPDIRAMPGKLFFHAGVDRQTTQ